MKKFQFIARLFSFMLSMLLISSLLASCANTQDPDITTEAPETSLTTTSPVDETTEDPNVDVNGFEKDNIPADVNFNGEVITLLVWDDVEHEEFFVAYDELSGDIVEQALFDRNSKVEERLGVSLDFIRIKGNGNNIKSWNSYVGNSVSINAREFDILAGYSISIAKNASSGYLYNMLDTECQYLDFTKPWWSELLLEQATFGDNLYFASGDISRNALEMMYVCFVNTLLLDEYNLENPQDFVDSGEWTYSKFIEMCQGVYKDTDGDGLKSSAKDTGDTFGYITYGTYADNWFYGSGATICEKAEDGTIIESPSFTGERVANTIDMLNDLFSSNYAIYTEAVHHQTAFGQGRSLFMTDRCRTSHKRLAAEHDFDDFLIVPCPKYDKDQEKYITVMGNPFTLYGIASDIEDPAMASAFIECFASEGYRQVTPAVFELSLKTRYVDDPVSANMYDIVKANITYDVGRIFSDDLIGQATFRNAIARGNSWGSVARQAATSLTKALVNLNAALNGN